MQLNDHTDIGLRLLMTLGASEPRRWMTKDLASVHGLSFTHVQKVVQSLESAGLVETFRGRGGGVVLADGARDVTVGHVVRRLESNFHLVRCFRAGASDCVLEGGCALAGSLRRARDAFFAELDDVTLGEVIQATPRALEITL